MSLLTFEVFQHLAELSFKIIGLQAYNKPNTMQKNSWLFYIMLINMNFILMWEAVTAVVMVHQGNMLQFIMNFGYIGFMLVTDMKILSVIVKRRQLSELMLELKHIYPNTARLQREYNVSKYAQQCRRISIGFIVLYNLLVWTYNLFSLFHFLIYDEWMQMRVVEKELPYFIYIPWQWQHTFWYPFLLLLQCVAGIFSTQGQICCELLLFAAVSQTVMHYDYVAKCIRGYKTLARNKSGKIAKTRHKKDVEFICDMIDYHVKVLRLIDKLNDVFGISLFFNLSAAIGVICFAGFTASIFDNTALKFKSLLGLLCTVVHMHLICACSERLIQASLNISSAVFHQDWFDGDPNYKKLLILIARRGQKPAQLRATSFIRISQSTMTVIFQQSYQLFTLLRAMYAKDQKFNVRVSWRMK